MSDHLSAHRFYGLADPHKGPPPCQEEEGRRAVQIVWRPFFPPVFWLLAAASWGVWLGALWGLRSILAAG